LLPLFNEEEFFEVRVWCLEVPFQYFKGKKKNEERINNANNGPDPARHDGPGSGNLDYHRLGKLYGLGL
jgi:hypothetical protein